MIISFTNCDKNSDVDVDVVDDDDDDDDVVVVVFIMSSKTVIIIVPIVVTLVGIVTDVNDLHPAKAALPR